ncbi:MAG: LamG domain-containing protein [Deltaproteobacteria bacterium]|nr:LamG domain-containing protein [Deltaproteobacteria bacterium]
MKVVGYTDRLSVAAGDAIRFMVSCEQPSYRADIVRLIHGDPNPRGPGFREEEVSSSVSREYPGRLQEIYTGSYVRIPCNPALRLRNSFTIQTWILPTTPQKGQQGIITKWLDNQGYGLAIDAQGALALWLSDAQGHFVHVSSGKALRKAEWYFVAATFDAQSGIVRLYQEPLLNWPQDDSRATVEQKVAIHQVPDNTCDLLIAAYWERSSTGNVLAKGHFNGKVDSPCVFSRACTPEEIRSLKRGTSPLAFDSALVAAWDFSREISSREVLDISPHRLHGETVNMPARAMTGYHWTGQETNFRDVPHQYSAIHFHDDDLDDAGWEVDFSLTIPAQMKSGIYAARLRTEGGEDYVPFVVRPKKGMPTARAVFLMPTNSYLAYANEQLKLPYRLAPNQQRGAVTPEDEYTARYGLVSLYDHHTDGSGVCYSSRLRPIMTLRPKYHTRILGCPHQFPADLHLVDWLEAKGHEYDVITDEDLHHDGLDLLASYKVVLTGSHPEYWTGDMLSAIEAHLRNGGRLMYLGGNGFYWVTAIAPQRPHVIEVRRWGGIRAWDANPGEYYLSTTGELGGLWRYRGHAPQKLAGVGFTAQGFDNNRLYQRQPASFDPRAAFIFAGIGKDELIGDFPSLVLNHGAAGFELDRADAALGTPPHALVLASSFGHSDSYQHVVEEVLISDSRQGGTVNPLVRADMVYFECAKGGAVFSTGSIAWCGSLSYNNYDNNVSRITDNVLRRFVAEEPLPERKDS